MGRKKIVMAAAAAALAAAALVAAEGAAQAAVTFDAGTGVGFVGKGDVQLALGLNNAQLQATADSLEFTYESVTSVQTTWTCDRDGGSQTQERTNTLTTTTSGVASAVARVKNQVTGFNLTGFEGEPSVSSEKEGPAVGTCPTYWTAINLVQSDPVVQSGGLYVNDVLLLTQ